MTERATSQIPEFDMSFCLKIGKDLFPGEPINSIRARDSVFDHLTTDTPSVRRVRETLMPDQVVDWAAGQAVRRVLSSNRFLESMYD